MNPKIYVYKMVADNGGAPCVWRGLLSLAICKPEIRKGAREGDIIFGFGGKRYEEELIYIAKVTAKPEIGEYYCDSWYAGRPDCIYHEVAGEARRKQSAHFHNESDERKRDVGLRFERAYVLLSDDFRYFGDKASCEYKGHFHRTKNMVESLKRGHRVNHPPGRYEELMQLKEKLWRKHSQKKIGKPNDSDKCLICNK